MKESEIESWSKALAKKRGWWVRKFKSPGNNAVPDDVFAKDGHIFFVEFKATGEEATDLQKDEHEEMREQGLTVYVCDAREKFAEILGWEDTMRARSLLP